MQEPYTVKWSEEGKKFNVSNEEGYPKVEFYARGGKILPMICFDSVEKNMTKTKKREAIACLKEKLFYANDIYNKFI